MNATMDIAICRETLSNLCNACTVLDIEKENILKWQSILDKLPEYEINEDGAMKEWLHPRFKDNYHHRHQSHLYPVFPGFEITEEENPEIFEACKNAVEKRLVIGLTSQTGWSMAHMANIYARLGLGNRALECIEILTRSSTGVNLFTYHNDWRNMGLSLSWGMKHPPFQIDANFGVSAAILEMLVFSKPNFIKILPALPDKWDKGSVKGVLCRGNITVNIEWDKTQNYLSTVIKSKKDKNIKIKFPDFISNIKNDNSNEKLILDNMNCTEITLTQGKSSTFVSL